MDNATEIDLGPLPDATSAADINMLSDALRSLPEARHQFMAYELVYKDLMRFTEEATQEALVFARENNALHTALGAMFSIFPQMATELVLQAADHCVDGKDETGEGVGGWSQDEVESAYASLYVARNGLTIPFGTNVQ